ncbi:hypothetical protein CW751_13235 [Brumimicrobium salinarum]|uniref:DUF5723 domain-containing protein n=1 Tax=Brumimicrobium salinarum TaxID=2058658 RepID=A0A2I0QZP6_9FLAO|nr:DUF5723 family protein [Brumimicrobium salinarum]PKR79789.1 hypothetical protein CW751_13235 [Brumimicrobium salinarum]
MKLTRITLLVSFTFLGYFTFSQSQGVAYTAVGKGVATTFLTDYHSLGINSSALGWGNGFEDKNVTLGTTEFSAGISSPTLDKTRLQNAFDGIKNQISGNGGGFDMQQQKNAAGDYAEAGIGINASFNWFGGAYQSEKFGGIAVSINEHYDWYSQLNQQTTDLLFRGRLSGVFDSLTVAMNGDTTTIANRNNISNDTLQAVIRGDINNPLLVSDLTRGSRIKFLWNRHFNIGYGRKIFGDREQFALYGGIGARFIQSVAMFDMESNNQGLSVNAAVSPFFNINFDGNQNNSNSGFMPETVGKGYGLDFSASVILLDKIKLAAAVNNVGSVTYKRDVYSVVDTLLGSYSLPGLDNAATPEAMNELADEGGILRFEGKEEIVISNPANFRLGGSIAFFENKLNVGFDVVAPFDKNSPGSLQNAVVSFGGDIRPVKWLQISAGYFGGGVYEHNIPVGVNFILKEGAFEFGISSRDALSFFLKDANSLSAAFGVARIRF